MLSKLTHQVLNSFLVSIHFGQIDQSAHFTKLESIIEVVINKFEIGIKHWNDIHGGHSSSSLTPHRVSNWKLANIIYCNNYSLEILKSQE